MFGGFFLLDAINIAKNTNLSPCKKEIRNVLICGLGGSGIGGTIVADIITRDVNIPIASTKDYDIPNFVNEYTLVVANSYSGNTEETLYALEKCQTKGAEIAIITSGGVSVGEADHIKSVLQSIGAIMFWKIMMKPGRPLAFGKIGSADFFGLPGNPVSVMITFMQFVLPALSKMAGRTGTQPLELTAKTTKAIRKSEGRTEFQRGILSFDDKGNGLVTPLGAQGSGILSSMTEANCLIHLTKDSGKIQAGDTVKIQPFELRLANA